MDFKKLHETLPYVTGGKKHILEYSPYNGVTLYFPGRHAKDTDPEGGDFVVTVDDENLDWVKHQFTHNDIFAQVEKYRDVPIVGRTIMKYYWDIVVNGRDPAKYEMHDLENGTVHPQTFLYAVQCLAVAEHRRYAKFETKGGGRYLPLRFANGIFDKKWTVVDAAQWQRRGRPGVEYLEKQAGIKFDLGLL